jgi:ribose-phosphate pyrophosphokinase
MLLDLTKGIVETSQYKAWKFPGGEIHFKFTPEYAARLESLPEEDELYVYCRLNSSDAIIFLGIALDTLAKDYDNKVIVFIPYFPYQQADRDFGIDECFSLITITKILNTFPRDMYMVFDPHSDVTPALLAQIGATHTVDNSEYIKWVLTHLSEDIVILSPDAGAYKKIFKLAEKIGFKGQIECANKFRPSNGGEPQIRLSTNNFEGKDILVIDDICVGGRTFVNLAKELIDKNVGDLHLAISHGIFSNGFDELNKYYTNIFTSNSVKDAKEYENETLKVFQIV